LPTLTRLACTCGRPMTDLMTVAALVIIGLAALVALVEKPR
jgi:hypothetical protein